MRSHQENDMRFIFSVFWVLLEDLAGIGISITIYSEHTMNSCLAVGLASPSFLDVGNTQEELQDHLGKGPLISPPPSLPERRLLAWKRWSGKSLSIFHYHLMSITHADKAKELKGLSCFSWVLT